MTHFLPQGQRVALRTMNDDIVHKGKNHGTGLGRGIRETV